MLPTLGWIFPHQSIKLRQCSIDMPTGQPSMHNPSLRHSSHVVLCCIKLTVKENYHSSKYLLIKYIETGNDLRYTDILHSNEKEDTTDTRMNLMNAATRTKPDIRQHMLFYFICCCWAMSIHALELRIGV